ncbi:MAG TPA: hypothetical protein VKZ41_09435 [Gemmatimonadales bacterium]|nr:hypothetical protein [Gemmatimonadales bacterium]
MATQTTTRIPITALWEKHLSTSFPPGLAGEEVEHMDLTLLDAATAGCIAEFLQNDGTLDLGRTAMLGLCHRHAAVAARELEGEGQEYFHRLETLAYEVLQAIRDRELPAG